MFLKIKMETCLEIKKLTKKLGKNKAISDLNLSISRGKKVALLGLNGAGKSSFIRLLVGESQPDSGDIIYVDPETNDQNLRSQEIRFKKLLGYQADTMLSITAMTGEEYLNLCGQLKGLSSKLMKGKLKKISQQWQIENLLKLSMAELSKGNLQKLAIAQAFINDPKWLFFDEPCQSLDPLEQDRFNQNIKSLSEIELCVFSTHNVEHALEMANDIVIFHQCKIAYHFRSENKQSYLVICKDVNSILPALADELDIKIIEITDKTFQLPSANIDQIEKLKNRLDKAAIKLFLPEEQAVMPLFRLLASGEVSLNSNEHQ